MAVVVETPQPERQPFDRARDLQEAVDDAVDLGAEVVRVTATDVVAGIVEVASQHGARHVVLPYEREGGLRRLVGRPLVDRLLERLPDLEIHLVAAPPGPR